jgi:Xaa-Pro aminopeptidase
MLSTEFSVQRQKRLLEVMEARRLDAVVVGASPHVYYFSAFLPLWLHQAGFVLFADGRSLLISANVAPPVAAADQVVPYEANWLSTLRQEQPMTVADKLIEALTARRAGSIGVDASAVSSQIAMAFNGSCTSIDADLWQLRRRKDPDELDLMESAIRCCEAMYARAKEIIEPGVTELHVFGELHAMAIKTAGEAMFIPLGNDYASGVPGGPPRKDRVAKEGEIYILDLGPTYRGYFSDNARSFSVNRKPTDAQLRAWESITGALSLVERIAKPGVRGADLFRAVDEHFKATLNTGLTHHLGHGVGLQPHEYPHLNPNWDDVLMEGEVFTAEPGQYAPAINGGIRLENQYLVTKEGVVNLVDYPLELT